MTENVGGAALTERTTPKQIATEVEPGPASRAFGVSTVDWNCTPDLGVSTPPSAVEWVFRIATIASAYVAVVSFMVAIAVGHS